MVSGTDSPPPVLTTAGGSAPAGVLADQEAAGLVATALDAVSRAGSISASTVGDALDSGARALVRRVVADAASRRRPAPDRAALARSLATRPAAPVLASATAAAVAIRFVSRFKRLNFLAKRSPLWLLATAVPALVASVSRGADELGMVAAYLIGRARAAGVEPDVDRVRRAAVQIVTHRPVDPDAEVSHGKLAVAWLRRAVRAALPFTSGVATADPEGLAAAADAVDPARLRA